MNRIREFRKNMGYSQSELASMLNVHQTAVSQWEQGRTSPDFDTAKKIAQYFNTSVDYLMGLNMTIVPADYPVDLDPMYYRFAKEVQSASLSQDELDNILSLIHSMKK